MNHHAIRLFGLFFLVMACGRSLAAPQATGDEGPQAERGDTTKFPLRDWDNDRDLPPHIAEDASIKFDYPIVYVRVPRPYPEEYFHLNHLNQAGLHLTNPPGAELRILHPDGRDESLVPVEPQESITDPMVSFDGEWVFFAKFHHMGTKESAHMTRIRSRAGADLYKVHVATGEVVRLTHQEAAPLAAPAKAGMESHEHGVHNLAPCPIPGGRLAFVSDRHAIRGVREQTQPALQLFVMDDDGRNVEHIGPLNLGTALHPTILKDGRIMFSSLETQGLRGNERWGIWAIHPDGTRWNPLTSALGSPPGQAVHFQAQLSDESIVVESYYQTGSTDGFGSFWKFPIQPPAGEAPFGPGRDNFAPYGLVDLTLFATWQDVRPNHSVSNVSNRHFMGNVTHPSGAPENHLLTVWALPLEAQDKSTKCYDAGIYLLKEGKAINHPSKMRLVKNDPAFQELWPRALVPYERIHGVKEPARLTHRNDGEASPHLPAGTPLGLVGSSSLYKRESYPGGVVPPGSVTAVSAQPGDRVRQWRELSVARFNRHGNWGEQGADAGLYENSDIWGIRIVITEPVSEPLTRDRRRRRHFALGSAGEERLRILGEFPVRKFSAEGEQPRDPDGNPDTSFLAKIPADVAWTFQTLDNRGMVLNMAQTWHQVRPGEIRNDCGGCHAHSQQPTPFSLTEAAKPTYPVWDLASQTPLFTTKEHDTTGRRWDAREQTGVRIERGVLDVEYHRDIQPILARSCVACHSRDAAEPAGNLVLDDPTPLEKEGLVPWAENVRVPPGLPHSYHRLAQYAWAFQSRRSPLVWKLHGERLDGFANEDVPSPELDYHDHQSVLNWSHHSKRFLYDVDLTGSPMPPPEAVAGTWKTAEGRTIQVPPLSDEEKITLARWIDLGCPIDLEYDPARPEEPGLGWLLDEGRPTLTLSEPAAGANPGPLRRILLGMHDYGSGLHLDSLEVTADFPFAGAAAGENLASRFKRVGEGIWELRPGEPPEPLKQGRLTITIADRQGNVARIDRHFTIGP